MRAGESWHDNDLVFCRTDGTGLDGWQVRREFAAITKVAGLGEDWTPRELRHSFVSVLTASDVPLADITCSSGMFPPASPRPWRAPPEATRLFSLSGARC